MLYLVTATVIPYWMFWRLITKIPQGNEPCVLMKHAWFSSPRIPMTGLLCSAFCLSHTVCLLPLSLFSFCWFSFTSFIPDALHSGGSGKRLRRERDLPGMSWKEAGQRKNLTPNPTQHLHVQLILVCPRSLARSILPLRRQRTVKLFFPKPASRYVQLFFHILNWILELIRIYGWMALYNLPDSFHSFKLVTCLGCQTFEWWTAFCNYARQTHKCISLILGINMFK